MSAPAHAAIQTVAVLIQALGVLIVSLGLAWALWRFAAALLRKQGDASAYVRLRADVGASILLGLEFLVAADIIETVTAPTSKERVLLLGAIVLIRTFLSFALETELHGVVPWKRGALPSPPRSG